jgi:hypothetical protein
LAGDSERRILATMKTVVEPTHQRGTDPWQSLRGVTAIRVPVLEATVTRRDSRNVVVVSEATGEEFVFDDASGVGEALLGILREGRLPRQAVIQNLTGRLDGVTASGVSAALENLDALGLLRSRDCYFDSQGAMSDHVGLHGSVS